MNLHIIKQIFYAGVAAVAGSYVPGTPGANWTTEELTQTKEKLLWVMKNPKSALQCTSGGLHAAYYYQYYYQDLDSILPTAAKIVRLGFHDCLPEKDTGAGCNGCLNLKGVGNRYFIYKGCENPTTDYIKYLCKYYEGDLRPQVQSETDNNNLYWVAAVLEDLYKDSLYGGVQSSQSLFDAGKSRADLWAFAALVAVRYTLERNNEMCENFEETQGCPLSQGGPDTIPNFCKFDLNSDDIQPVFRTGRSDCVSDCSESWAPEFCTKQHEIHPNPHFAGNETGKFMNVSFGLNVQVGI